MSYTNKYYPDYEKIYPDVKLTPAVLAALRQSDRQMRRFEEELKAEHFEFDMKSVSRVLCLVVRTPMNDCWRRDICNLEVRT